MSAPHDWPLFTMASLPSMTAEDDVPNNPVNSTSCVPELSTSSNQPNCTANEPELAMQSNVSPFFYLNLPDVAATQSSHTSSRPGTPTDQLNTENSDLNEVPPQAEVSCPLVTPTTFVAPKAPPMPVMPTTVAPKDLGPLPPIPDCHRYDFLVCLEWTCIFSNFFILFIFYWD